MDLAVGIASGMAHLHERNIIHGDLNPANVLLKQDSLGCVRPTLMHAILHWPIPICFLPSPIDSLLMVACTRSTLFLELLHTLICCKSHFHDTTLLLLLLQVDSQGDPRPEDGTEILI